jgi:hypothetical protein
MLPDLALGVVLGGGVALASVLIAAFIFIILLIMGGEDVPAFLIATLLTCFIAYHGASGAGRGNAGLIPKDPLAFAIGTCGLPLLALTVLIALSPNPAISLISSVPFLVLTASIALGGYNGCSFARAPYLAAQLGIGHTCAACNYDLTATADHQPCPECGNTYRLAPPDSATSPNQPPHTPRTPNPPTYNPPN